MRDVTSDIKWLRYVKEYNKKPYFEVTYSNGKVYPDSIDNIDWIKEPKQIDIEASVPYRGETAFFDIILALRFGNWFRFFFGDGSVRSYHSKEIKWVAIANKEEKVASYLEYLADVTCFLEGDQSIIKKQLKGLTVPKESFLYSLTNNIENKTYGESKNKLIFPCWMISKVKS